jgi:NAD(P)-dependent dehydrogenase (short-subunit alcohol dehydrogenase family)
MTALNGQVALVTGASSGIGRAIAAGLAAEGASLCLVGRRREALDSVAADIRADSRVAAYCADLARDQDIEELVARVGDDFGRVDILVHSAGAISLGPVESAPVEDLDRQYRTNLRAPYLLTQRLLPLLRSSHGQIVFVNSSAAAGARARVSQYAATKAALKAMADSLRDEVNAAGIRVLSVFPGRTASPMQEAVHEMVGEDYRPERLLQPRDVAAAVLNALRMPRSAEVTDINIRPMAKS